MSQAIYLTDEQYALLQAAAAARGQTPEETLNELLTVYTIVNALTVNLPAVNTVQVLVDGKEVETLSGHVDLRAPLAKNLSWVQ